MALTDNIVSYWKLDGNSNDANGSNNGSDTSITYSEANGKIVQGAGFNGSSSKITLPTTSIPNGNSARTLSVWVYKTSTSVDVVYGSYKGTNDSPGSGWGIYINNTDVYCWLFGPQDFDTGINISLNTWTHLVLTYDGTNIRAYKNGSLESTTAKTLNTTNTYHFLGVNISGNFFNGAIDEVGIWSRALTTDEITELYNSGNGLQYPFTLPETSNSLFFANNF